MKGKKNREINIFSVSFLDVLANTIGGLAFLLIFTALMIGIIVFGPPIITTQKLPDGYHQKEYTVWLGAREGLGKFHWSFGEGERPKGLQLDSTDGKLSGVLALASKDGGRKTFEFTIVCESRTDTVKKKPDSPQVKKSSPPDTTKAKEPPKLTDRKFQLTVRRQAPIDVEPLRILTGKDLPAAFLRQPYPLAFAAEGGQTPYRWTASGDFPAGLNLTAEGRITGAPSQARRFRFNVTVATPQGESRSDTVSLAVSEKYPPPPPVPPLRVLTQRIPDAVAERNYYLTLAAQGGTPPYTWSANGIPNWLQANSNATAFAGRPGLLDIDSSRVIWQVTDSRNSSAQSDPMKLEVLPPAGRRPPPLRIKTQSLPDARVAQAYELAVAVEGGFPPYTWTSSAAVTAIGVSFAATDGALRGTPTRAGNFSFPITVTDVANQQATVDLQLRVHPPLLPLQILTNEKAPEGRAGQSYNLALSAVGGFPPYRWQFTSGELPSGLTLDESSGRISGTLMRAGTWRSQLAVTDAAGQSPEDRLALEMIILTSRGVRQLIITTKALPTLLAGESADVTLACEGGAEPYQWQTPNALPDGVRLESGRIVGEPSSAGTYDVKLIVNDASGETATAMFKLVVKNMVPKWLAWLLGALLGLAFLLLVWLIPAYLKNRRALNPQPLRILTDAIPNARASCDYTVQLACIGGSPPYRWRVTDGELPPGLQLTPEGKILGRPFENIGVDKTKDVPFTVEVKDDLGATATQRL